VQAFTHAGMVMFDTEDAPPPTDTSRSATAVVMLQALDPAATPHVLQAGDQFQPGGAAYQVDGQGDEALYRDVPSTPPLAAMTSLYFPPLSTHPVGSRGRSQQAWYAAPPHLPPTVQH
jgi:hypothetical protein